MPDSGVVEGISDEEARKQIEVNFWAPVRISREAVRWFRENNPAAQGGRVLNISSCGGFISNPTLAYYSASKFVLEGFSEGLNKELDPSWNIRIIVIQPGGVRTRWANGSMLDLPFPPAYADPTAIPTQFRNMLKNGVPMNDTNKVSKALIALSKEADPPVRLPLGADARYVIQGKIDAIQKELAEWKELEVSVVADAHFFEKLTGTVM
ncbi:NAD(P)-binding protein [Lentinus tigrinus ALCF2SS1-7]|uniref:NAD(P)-binding protein n=1 Tax=Lentinus tigrinus ALCF2SS1-6 TaxID=1328759 RepID=A0A5C2T7H4_9APHY|nr:NAD(P)-binding protein [Lentinus tigrinus ALCF2SS1-6]RPD81493.1 NAD(P)-binding protein [Lentinus tigrinus ALCF2SS1-7]